MNTWIEKAKNWLVLNRKSAFGAVLLLLLIVYLSGIRNDSISSSNGSVTAGEMNASRGERKVIGMVGFPVEPMPEPWKSRNFKWLQEVVDSCLKLGPVFVNENKLIITVKVGETWVKGYDDGALNPINLRIRYFDEDGDYLGHFSTKEMFVPEWGYDSCVKEFSRIYKKEAVALFRPIKESGTELIYKIDASKASLVHYIEVSASDVKKTYLKNEGKSALITKEEYFNRDYFKK